MGTFLSSPWPLSSNPSRLTSRISFGGTLRAFSLFISLFFLGVMGHYLPPNIVCMPTSPMTSFSLDLFSRCCHRHGLVIATWTSPGDRRQSAHPWEPAPPSVFSITENGVDIRVSLILSTDTITNSRIYRLACKSNPSSNSILILF